VEICHLQVSSIHVMCIKQRLTEEDMTPELEAEGYEPGDVMIRHIDSFSSNTAQGGYETICAQAAAWIECKSVHPDLDEIVLCSDQGSGYKSTQTILGLRAMKEWGGPRVMFLLFNGLGEGKRYETDGHMSFLKWHRRNAMRAGLPPQCTTPKEEVLAQQYLGGYNGVSTHYLQFGYDKEKEISKWEGISTYHDFELRDDSSIVAWKSYKIGPGKIFSKEYLDSLYTVIDDDASSDNTFPQPPTKAEYVSVASSTDASAAEPRTVKLEKSKKRK